MLFLSYPVNEKFVQVHENCDPASLNTASIRVLPTSIMFPTSVNALQALSAPTLPVSFTAWSMNFFFKSASVRGFSRLPTACSMCLSRMLPSLKVIEMYA